jgi:hypothetical protein
MAYVMARCACALSSCNLVMVDPEVEDLADAVPAVIVCTINTASSAGEWEDVCRIRIPAKTQIMSMSTSVNVPPSLSSATYSRIRVAIPRHSLEQIKTPQVDESVGFSGRPWDFVRESHVLF